MFEVSGRVSSAGVDGLSGMTAEAVAPSGSGLFA